MAVVEHPVPSTQYPVPSTQYQVPNTEYQVPNTEYNTKCFKFLRYSVPTRHVVWTGTVRCM